MTWELSLYSIVDLVAAGIALMVVLVNWPRRHYPGLRMLVALQLSACLWCVFTALEMSVVELEAKFLFIKLADLCINFLIPSILLFIIDYFGILPWLTPRRRRVIWVIATAQTALEWTNPLHHWNWISYSAKILFGRNTIAFQYGPAFPINNGVSIAFGLISILLAAHQVFRLQGTRKKIAIGVLIGIVVPFIAYALDNFATKFFLGLEVFPLGFAFSGLILSYIIQLDVQQQLQVRTQELELSVGQLNQEISESNRLKNKLLEMQESLSNKLAEQSHKMIGLYDLVVISESTKQGEYLLKLALEKIQTILECDAVVYYSQADEFLKLNAQTGLGDEQKNQMELLKLPADLLLQDVTVLINNSLLPAMRIAGYQAGTLKKIEIWGQELGVMACLWKNTHQFMVDEIALAGAVADVVGVVLENERLREITKNTVKLEERRRLARDMHDSVTQSLHSLVYSAETANRIIKTKPEQLPVILNHLVASASQALKEMRLLLFELRLLPLQEIDLMEALTLRLESVERRAGIDARLMVDDGVHWPKDWDRELYPIAMEALNNSLKHGRGSEIIIKLGQLDDEFSMSVQDNGLGFDPLMMAAGGMGLQNMAERAKRLGGTLTVDARPDHGVRIVFTLIKTFGIQ